MIISGTPANLGSTSSAESSPISDASQLAMSLTPYGRIRVESTNPEMRRLQESMVLEMIEHSYRNFVFAEPYGSERRGYEIR